MQICRIVMAVLFSAALCSMNIAYAQITFLFPSTTTNATNPTTTNATTTNAMMDANVTGSIPLGPAIAKAIASQVHVNLANASTTAEKAIGVNAHSVAVKIRVVHGFLVYMALVVDSSNNFHGVLVDPGNGKVIASTPVSFEAMMRSEMGMMMGSGMMGESYP